MGQAKRVFGTAFILFILLSLTAWGRNYAAAQEAEAGPRQTTIVVPYTEYEWWLIRWIDNQIVCQLYVEHEGVPTGDEVFDGCGKTVYDEWLKTQPCSQAGSAEAPFSCSGLYFHLVSFRSGEREVKVEIPSPVVWLDVVNCSLSPPQNICPQLPSLKLTGEEPLPNEEIIAIHGLIDDAPFSCQGPTCEITLAPTPLHGLEIEFWAESSFGDMSPHFFARVRVLESGVAQFPGGGGWYIDILSTQWRGAPVEACAEIWQSFPPAGGAPLWASTPPEDEFLNSDQPYYYLAGRLIANELVDAADCPAGGLLANGYANACGLEKARDVLNIWQDQFDPRIYAVAQEMRLPAQIMKNLFAQESQFWPGVFKVRHEYGLGQMTELGADSILLWNVTFFDQFCPLVLDGSACARGYLRLEEEHRAILRGALAVSVNADCPDCPAGIDLTRADMSVALFANSLKANCEQVGQTLFNATQFTAGEVSAYEDLWKFTIANYHAGPGCVSYAIHSTWLSRDPMDWEHVSGYFTEACQSALNYVDLIAR